VVTVRNQPFPDAQTYHGHAGLVQAWADWTADFEAVEMEIGEIRRSGREIVLEVVQRGIGRREVASRSQARSGSHSRSRMALW
jgi:hypothetical protein